MTYRTRIKICGITNLDDAHSVASLGVDAIGLMFYSASSRYIEPSTAKKIVLSLPAFIASVGVFANAESEQINHIMQHVPLNTLQFHGNETAEFCRQFNRPYIKAITMREHINLTDEINKYPDAQAILVDTYHPKHLGGSGEAFEWQRLPETLPKPLILAGGLNPTNIAHAINTVNPYAVDVSSGVEKAKGIKDHQKITAFINAVNQTSGNL